MMVPQPNDKIVIVGAGCFGISTAYHLLKRGFTDVTVLDRSPTLPARDAASSDFNRVVRSAYSDIFYTKLAREAIHSWKDKSEWEDSYHQCGVLVLGSSDNKEQTYTEDSFHNDVKVGAALQKLPDGRAIRGIFPPEVRAAGFNKNAGYINFDGGWANATQGLAMMTSKVMSLKGKVVASKNVIKIIRHNGRMTGVECSDHTFYDASLLVVATGSWTHSAFPELKVGSRCLATGQCVAMMHVTSEEAKVYNDCPVVLDLSTGFYVFPPTDQGIIKMAIHLPGYTRMIEGISTPWTVVDDPDRGLLVPRTNLQALRKCLREVYPVLAEKPFSATRLCWYNDSPDGNWIIGRDPADSSIMFATAGSGHAYKFLPVIGRLVADAIQETLDPSIHDKFAPDRQYSSHDESRSGFRAELDLHELCEATDLLP
ncbi:FAD dependent oxidoreductase [Tricholoma matsutake]|nr:FAD dependent oxidoreductase [Tricholoma matsutake 945]